MISALVPARDCAPWIRDALQSLARQTLPPDEILLYDDGSQDETVAIAEGSGIASLRVLRGEGSGGISRALNQMLSRTEARYIVRMDADDVAEPDRIESQMRRLERGDLAVVGSWARRFGRSDTLHQFAEDDAELKAGLVFASPFCHPSVVLDRQRLRDASKLVYDPEFDGAEDHDLWIRLRHEGRYGNLPRVLLRWRLHTQNAGSHPEKLSRQLGVQARLRSRLLEEMGVVMDAPMSAAFEARCAAQTLDLAGQARYLDALHALSQGSPSFLGAPREVFLALLGTHWDLSCHMAAHQVRGIPSLWRKGRARLGLGAPAGTYAKLALKSLLRAAKDVGAPPPTRRPSPE